jgi:hypothetical protein
LAGAKYPIVRDEQETLTRILAGASIARYGDGEFKLIRQGLEGHIRAGDPGIKSQSFHPVLSRRLLDILNDSGSCMVGIPNIFSATPKRQFWNKFQFVAEWLSPRPYASSFITRPDSAPWIATPTYWDQIESLWLGRDVTLVRGSGKSLTAEDLSGAGVVREIVCLRQHAFTEYASLLERIGTPDRALLCCGPTATVLAVDLCARGVQAIDLGHIGMFLKKYRRGDPMWVTDVDRQPQL